MQYTIKQFRAEYPSDEACLDKIMELRYGGKELDCPACKKPSKFHRIKKRRAYACQNCGHHIFPCVGTPFEKSRTPLSDWFFAMYLMTSTRHGVAAKELERQIGCTYKTAWRMAHELRKLMANADKHGPLSGHVEIDETMVGGRKPGKRGRGSENKTVVFGMVERDGTVRAGPVPNVKRATLQPIIQHNIKKGSTISSDEFLTYQNLSKLSYKHGVVNHSAREYAKGEHHVNSMEGFWSRLKNSIRGTHVHVSSHHLWKYVSEFSYRYNMRKQPEAIFPSLVSSLSLPHPKDG